MQFVRVKRGEQIVRGYKEGEILVLENGEKVHESEAHFLAPVEPTKIIAMHLNFPSRIEAFGIKDPRWPSYFMKPLSSLAGHRAEVARPRNTQYLNYEGEIALVIGKKAKGVSREEAWDYIAGYSPVIDYGLHDFRTSDAGSMLRVKGQDGFCPMGPTLIPAHEVDPHNITVRTYVNGKVAQEGNTGTFKFSFDYIIADLSRLITLEPGDVILTGTPANSRPVQPGDVVEVEIEGYPRLTTTVVESEVDFADFGAQPEDSDNARNTAFEIE
ncbi:5-oxopent-3-ene-1,2,5-tricarboxylate decarboxylase/2-hydroxyhepta-2,4-diene-1,7-dioate isomerase [Aneurinibacillus soli]|uniref:Homoprotocatechuate catabolism bifunctional isomerase/decarboxylase n=1 Tax=Aneurinibacillus soli TaxID=1500254 RepID=A0A0U5BI65_9BACL|nr:fumarylacetoacetate hydrolase family protein [Aneurinibacillus soli]PYE61333.1 5-oxopent-3-ene-1,2,5-tricarboxylate decarboxylase/2-hydroxyhepta-2,4-diene-1,7-dioate isomerase [Aneurinibacillus soli]BAU27838.1 Homoprotocatechuate catabolism bifunctional isomerase/decarboxylase [Aneurinibacillus soli]